MKKSFYLFVLLFNALTLQAQKPTITNFSPTSGVVGTTVTITGTNFNATAAQNVVFFGATKATVTVASATSLTVTVPAGATFQPVSVLNSSTTLTGFSSQPFRVTYAGGSISDYSFEDGLDFAAGTGAVFIASGDLNGDGKADLITANYTANTISILRNTSTLGVINATSLAAKVDFATATNPRSIAVGDIDGDGKLDLAVANFGSNSVSVFRNTSSSGSISFAAKVDFATGLSPRGVNIGDFDGDGKPDLAIAHRDNNFISVLRNTSSSGSISFLSKVDFYLTGGQIPTFVNSADLDGDGKLDLAVTSYSGLSNIVSVFRNTATSGTIDANTFAAKVEFTTGGGPFSLAIGDLDYDGKPDLVTANYQGNNDISVLRNTGSNGSISFATKVDFALGVSPISANIGDLDGDGKLDLISTNYSTNEISILRNISTSGNITTNSFDTKVNLYSGTGPRTISICDLDGDGKPDLAVANETDNSVTVTHNPYISVPTNITTSANICMNNTASLSATCPSGTTTAWYNLVIIITPGVQPTPLFVGSPFVTPPLTATTTYTVRCEQGLNVSPRLFIPVNVSSNPSPAAPTITASGPTTFCNGGSVTLNSNVGNNNALNLVKASSQYVTVPHSASINLGATFTMEAWVKYSGTNVTIIDKGDYDFLWSLNPNINSNQMGFYTKNTGAWSYSTGIIPQNTWTHVAITLNAGTLTFYINGVASGTAAVTFSQDNQPMNIGRQQPTYCVCNHFNGTMDELRLWNVVRTQVQLQSNMNNTIPTNSAGLVAYYKFDEGTGSTTADATGNGNNGTLVNTPTWQVPATSPVNAVLWSPGGATTSTIVVTTAGTYTATIKNGYGCSSSASIITSLGSNAALVTLASPADDYATGIILKTASSVNGKITATNKVTGISKVTYNAKSIQLDAGFKADNGTVFSAAVGGCN